MDEIAVDVRAIVKAGLDDDENEDAAEFRAEGDHVLVAVADGATEAAFSRAWARSLVVSLVEDTTSRLLDRIERARQAWALDLPARDTLPWYGQAKYDDGSSAALAVVRAQRGPRRYRWSADFVGDCQLFAISAAGRRILRRAVPFGDPAAFGTAPSLALTQVGSTPLISSFRGELTGPAEVWVTTDAFAHAMLTAHANGTRPWDAWSRALGDQEVFEALVGEWRLGGQMRNDDVTVVRVTLP